MPNLSNGQLLDSTRFTAVIRDTQERFQRNQPLRFLDRTRVVPADDDEIIGTFTGQVFTADLVADDQAAAVYEAGTLTLATTTIPNLKAGKRFSQSLISRLDRIRSNGGTRDDAGYFGNWESRAAADLLLGVRERMNALICAMWLDNNVYNRHGIVVSGSWGMPSDLKFTPTNLWTDATNADPITDILTAKQYGADNYGEVYDRLTLSTADLRNAFATAKFKAYIGGLTSVNAPLVAGNFSSRDPRFINFLSEATGVEIEVDDKQTTVQSAAGARSTTRVLPAGKAILSCKADDNTGAGMDFANAVVTEGRVAGILGLGGNIPTGEQYGPMAYYTGDPQLNPPNLIAWGVARGFPRKFRPSATSVITVA